MFRRPEIEGSVRGEVREAGSPRGDPGPVWRVGSGASKGEDKPGDNLGEIKEALGRCRIGGGGAEAPAGYNPAGAGPAELLAREGVVGKGKWLRAESLVLGGQRDGTKKGGHGDCKMGCGGRCTGVFFPVFLVGWATPINF